MNAASASDPPRAAARRLRDPRFAAAPLAVVAALAAAGAQAESRVSAVAAAAPMNTTARLNVAVVVPRILYLRVGDAGATVNTVTFTVGLAATSNAVYANAVPGTLATSVTATDNNGPPNGQVAVQLWTNNGTSNLGCSGAALSNGASTIPLSQITVTAIGGSTLPHPGGSLACTSAAVGSAGTNALAGTWRYAFAPASLPAAGTYTTVVTYTAAQP